MLVSKYYYICLLPFTVLCFACPLVTWESLSVTCSIAEDDSFYDEEYVQFFFSIDAHTKSVENSISLQADSVYIEMDFSWDANKLYVKPKTGWQKGVSYRLLLQGEVRTEDNRSYPVHIQRNFRYGQLAEVLELIAHTPKNTARILNDEFLTFSFNKPITISSFEKAFSLYPAIQMSITYNNEKTLVSITPKDGWVCNTVYTWELGMIESQDGYFLQTEHSGVFYAPHDTVLPEIVSVHPVTMIESTVGPSYSWRYDLELDGNLHEKFPIGFVFNKPIDIESLRSALSFEPTIPGYVVADKSTPTQFLFIPEQHYSLDTRYTLSISTSLQDTAGLRLFSDKQFYFTSAQRYLEVLSINFGNTIVARSFPAENAEYTVKKTDNGNELEVYIHFSSAIGSKDKKRSIEAVSMQAFFPTTANTPVLQEVSWNLAGDTLFMRWNNFSVSEEFENQYKLFIRGGVDGPVNQAGEYIKEDLWLVFTVR